MVLAILQSFIVPLGAWMQLTTSRVNGATDGIDPGSFGVTNEIVSLSQCSHVVVCEEWHQDGY